jgi:hypothetical protein
MKKNEDVCKDMNVSEILCFFRAKYAKVTTRSCALSKLKKKFLQTKDFAFCNELKLSYDEYKQVNSRRKVKLVHTRTQPQLSPEVMHVLARWTIENSSNPRVLLPCLVLVTGIKPTLLLKDQHDNLDPILSTKLQICQERWPCDTLSCSEMHQHYQSSWNYHLKKIFPSITFANLCRLSRDKRGKKKQIHLAMLNGAI